MQKLSHLRQSNCAFTSGDQVALHLSTDCYVFARQAGDYVAVVAINKNPGQPCSIENLKTTLADGSYSDRLGAEGASGFNGIDLTVSKGISSFVLPPASVSVWFQNMDTIASVKTAGPWIGSVRPPVVSGGTSVTVYGHGFGHDPGTLMLGSESMDIRAWTDKAITFTAPYKSLGLMAVTVERGHGVKSKSATLIVVESRLIPVRFMVGAAPLSAAGDQIFITGSAVNLGQGKTTWQDAAGPMIYSDDDRKYILCVPMPAGKTAKLKLVILNKDGKLVQTEASPHTYRVPPEGCWKHDLVWQR
jgi:hypothetical protein